MPSFIPQLLQQFSLVGGVLEYRDRHGPSQRLFSFVGPREMALFFEQGSVMNAVVEHGYFPIANESDGSVWVMRPEDAGGPVFLLQLPEWNGQEPTTHNGLLFASDRLSFLLASMAISEASYYATSATPTSVMWYRGQKA